MMFPMYRHFKGNLYVVVSTRPRTHDDIDKYRDVVIYMRKGSTGDTFERPYDEFHGMHESGVKRFEFVEMVSI